MNPENGDQKKGGSSLGVELETMLEREVGFMGKHILRKQCQDMDIKLEEIGASNLKPLSTRISKAIIPLTGEKRALEIQKGILEYVKALETSAAPSATRVEESTQVEAELTIAEKKLAIGRTREAEAAARRAMDIVKQGGKSVDLITQARTARLLARVLSSMSKGHGEAKAMYDEAIAERSGDRYELALCWNGLGSLSWRTGEHKTALEQYQRALKILAGIQAVSKGEKVRLDTARATIHSGLGNVYLDLVDTRSAIEHNERALEIFRNMENWPESGRVYNNLARVYEEMRDFRKAIDSYERGIQFCQKGKAARMEGWTLTNLASALTDSGHADDARKHLDRAERILSDFSDPVAHSKLDCMWGKYHRERREWQMSIERFKRSIAVLAGQSAPDYLATTQEEFGTLYQKKGDTESAITLLKEALEWQRKKGDKYRITKIEGQLREMGKM
ncbi:MAG: tetratricopeptide repeat protein [Euryarchaeota archaeon]|nr:tetratricopeptide repeat protein [Euryarchaeota archaeon]